MNKVILLLQAVGFCFAFGQALQCYECKIGIGKLCITSKTTCESGEQCFSGVGTAAGFVPVSMKGCLSIAKCNMTKEENFPIISNATAYSMTKTCCTTDLCNAAPGLPGASGLSVIITTLSALLVANALV